MKRMMVGLFGAVVGLVLAAGALRAASTDTCVVYVTPPTNYAVSIATPSTGIDFGDVALNEVKFSSQVAGGIGMSTVTNSGSVTADWTLRALHLDTWQLSPTGDKSVVASDQMNLAVIFSSATYGGQITEDCFSDSDVINEQTQNIATTNYTIDDTSYDGDDIGANVKRGFWVRIKAPSATTVTSQQKFRLYVEAHAASLF